MNTPLSSRLQAVSTRRSRCLQCAGLFLLVAGLLLLDRGFVSWRNDPRTLPDASGAFPAGLPAAKAAERRWLMFCGGGMVLLSIALFTREPV